MDEYIDNYINKNIIITGNDDDMILSCNIRYDLNKDNDLFLPISYQAIAKRLLTYKSIKKRIIKGSMHYIGVRYKENNQ
jgi:hypothetical protein